MKPDAFSCKVLVLLAARNGEKWVVEQIDSILAQEGVSVNLIAADDASTDATRACLAELAQTSESITVVCWEMGSGSAGKAFKKLLLQTDFSGYDYVALSDQDDIWSPNKIRNAVTALMCSSADGYSSSVKSFWEDGTSKVLHQCPKMRDVDYLFEGAGQGCTFVLPVKTAERVSGIIRRFDRICQEFHYHDWLIYLLVRSWGGQWFFDQNPQLYYRQHSSNEIGARGGVKSICRRIFRIRNGWYGHQVRLATELCLLINPDNCLVQKFSRLIGARESFLRCIAMTIFVLIHGRRRVVDRAVLCFAVIVGWL